MAIVATKGGKTTMAMVYRKIYTAETEEELMEMTRDEVTRKLNDKKMRFCEEYIKNYNIKIAASKAGFAENDCHLVGWRLRQEPDVNRYIAWLKLRVSYDCHVTAMDIIDQYIKIAFADVTDYVKVKGNKVFLLDSSKIDGQLVTEIRKGKDGVTIKLADKLAALEKLERYFDVMPKDWKQKIEERKVELLEQKLELEKLKSGFGEEEGADDGFIEALKASAEEVWED